MSSDNAIRATRAVPGRAPQQATPGRVCEAIDCETVLSRYNKRTFCHSHWPIVIPIQRGVEKKVAA